MTIACGRKLITRLIIIAFALAVTFFSIYWLLVLWGAVEPCFRSKPSSAIKVYSTRFTFCDLYAVPASQRKVESR